MTRETKLGICVAGTFLAVVGTWAGVKLHRGEPESPTEPATAAAAQTDQTASAPQTAAPQGNQVSSAPNLQTPTSTTPAPQSLMASVTATPTTEPAPMAIKTEPVPIVDPNPGLISGPSPTAKNNEPPPPAMDTTTPPPANIGGAPNANESPALPAPVTMSPPASIGSTPESPAPAASNQPTPVVGDTPLTPTPPVMESKKDGNNAKPPETIVITKPADPAPPAPIQQPTVSVVSTGVATAASLGPPGGGTNPVATGVSAPRPKAEPRVQSYLEEEYRWQPGDRFEAVSQKYYFSEKYAAALQQYNRDYPLAGVGMRQNPPAMVPGQAIWVPPVRILERDYPTYIADLQELNERGLPVSAVRPADSSPQASGGTKLTKVRDRGETMYEIARRALNDSGQWIVVHRLNPTLSRDPKLPIPAGTVLRVPAEAKIETSDLP